MIMDRLVLLRHETTEANLKWELSAYHTKVCEQGRERTLQWAQYHAGKFDDMIVISNAQPRCLDLFTILTAHNNFSHTIVDPRFDERKFGAFIKKTKEETIALLSKQFPDLAQRLWDDFSSWMDQELIGEDGSPIFESNKKMKERVSLALMQIMDTYPGKDILIITSTGILRTLQAKFLWKTTQEYDKYLTTQTGYNRIPNLALTEFQWDQDTLTYALEHFNVVLHHQDEVL